MPTARVSWAGRGHVSLLTNSDTWYSKLVRDIGYLSNMLAVFGENIHHTHIWVSMNILIKTRRFGATKLPARPHRNAAQNRFAMKNVKGA